jgi:hydroxymethylpyrimidine kinase/phosphomethylpyrimidine kinase
MSGVPNILAVAGSDPSGGAGIQADLKSIMACGGYGMAAITALTAQNTQGVRGAHIPPAAFLRDQLEAVADDVRIDAVKIGMLGSADIVDAVSGWFDALPGPRPLVVLDPVMVATSGDRLLHGDAERALHALIGRADLVTPNLPELAVLTGDEVADDWEEALRQARGLARRHDVLVLAKGGHLPGPSCPDALVAPDGEVAEFAGERIETTSTHGTGCSLSAAVATLRARTGDWAWAVRLAHHWLRGALAAADGLDVGRAGGHGPLHHAAALWDGRRPPRRDAELDAWWEDSAALRGDIDNSWFVEALAEGSLPRADFLHYLAQDALYLGEYARLLGAAAASAPTLPEREFWLAAADSCLTTELALHEGQLGGSSASSPSRETRDYLDHLRAAADHGDHGVLVAALLPCFWLYRDVGIRLAAAGSPGHPYADWLVTYSDPGFDRATDAAIGWTQQAARRADDERLRAMREAFDASARHELSFFSQRRQAVPEAGSEG